MIMSLFWKHPLDTFDRCTWFHTTNLLKRNTPLSCNCVGPTHTITQETPLDCVVFQLFTERSHGLVVWPKNQYPMWHKPSKKTYVQVHAVFPSKTMWPAENPFNALYGLLSHQMRKLIHQKLREPYGDLPRAHRIKIHWSNLLKLEKKYPRESTTWKVGHTPIYRLLAQFSSPIRKIHSYFWWTVSIIVINIESSLVCYHLFCFPRNIIRDLFSSISPSTVNFLSVIDALSNLLSWTLLCFGICIMC